MSTQIPRPALPRINSDWLRVTVMGVFLAILVFVVFFYNAGGAPLDTGVAVTDVEDATPVPELDPAILALAKDKTRTERIAVDTEPLEHLLEKSLRVTPSVAHKLNMPLQALPIARLRRNADSYRGRYLWYKGQLEYLSQPKPGHPVPGYQYYEGRLRTEDGEPVLFAFTVPPAAEIAVGSWVRIEGFFMKLRDAHLPVTLNQAPMLVGPELMPAYPDWEAVAQLDPAVMARVHDGTWDAEGRRFESAPDMARLLDESQDTPLWHLASYALARSGETPKQWRKIPAFVTEDQFERFRAPGVARGTPMRILGTFVQGRILPAKVNPLGIGAWTEAWIQVRDLGGKTIPVWIPGAIDRSWQRNQEVACRGYFFKRYSYTTLDNEVRWTPLFVAADLHRFELSDGMLTNQITYAFGGLVVIVGLIFFTMNRRDQKQRALHEQQLTERRRRRLAREQHA